MSLGLYVHVPFCSAICNYCNFNRGLFDAALKTRYVEALLQELRLACELFPAPPQADTLYFGGGTPSLLEPADVRTILRVCREELGLVDDADAEVTLEANPESVDETRLREFRRA